MLLWFVAIVFAMSFTETAGREPDPIGKGAAAVLGALLCLTGGWVLALLFTVIKRRGVPTWKQTLCVATAIAAITVYGQAIKPSVRSEIEAKVARLEAERASDLAPSPSTSQAPQAAQAQSAAWETLIAVWKQQNAEFLADPQRKAAMESALVRVDEEYRGKVSNGRLIALAEDAAFEQSGWKYRDPAAWEAEWNRLLSAWSKRNPAWLSNEATVALINANLEIAKRERQWLRPADLLAETERLTIESLKRSPFRRPTPPARRADSPPPLSGAEEYLSRVPEMSPIPRPDPHER